MYKLVTTAKDSYYENYDKVLDLCSGEGTFLVSVLSDNYSQSITGVEINPTQKRISEMRFSS